MLELNLKKSEKSRSMNTKKICKRALLKVYITSFILLTLTINITAQVGIGTNNPDNSAALHIEDTARGILIPRMTLTQRQAIQSPAEGLMVYQTTNPAGFWYFSNNQWNNLAGAANGGKQTLILSDNITNAEAQAKILAEVGANTQEIRIVRCTNLTTVDLSMLTGVTQIYIVDNPVLQQVNFANLKNIEEVITLKNCPQLNSINLNALEKIGQSFSGEYGLEINATGLTNLNLPQLKEIYGRTYIFQNEVLNTISIPQLSKLYSTDFLATRIDENNSLTSINLQSLTQSGALSFNSNNLLNTLNLNSYTTCTNYLTIVSPSLTNITLPLLTTITGSLAITCQAMTSFSAPLLTSVGTEINFQGNSAVTGLSFPSLNNGLLRIYNSGLSTLSIPQLISGGLDIQNCSSLSSINANLLTNASGITIIGPMTFANLSFPALTTTSGLYIDNISGISTIGFPVLSTISGNILIRGCSNLSSVNLNAYNYNNFTGTIVNFSNNLLPSNQVNSILNKLVNAVPIIRFIEIFLSQTIPAPPTGQGITDKNILISRNNQVYTN